MASLFPWSQCLKDADGGRQITCAPQKAVVRFDQAMVIRSVVMPPDFGLSKSAALFIADIDNSVS